MGAHQGFSNMPSSSGNRVAGLEWETRIRPLTWDERWGACLSLNKKTQTHLYLPSDFRQQGCNGEYELSCRPESPMGNARHVKHLLGPSSRYKTSRTFPARGSNVRRSFRTPASLAVSDARSAAVTSTSGYALRRNSA